MQQQAFYPAFLGTFISVAAWCYFAFKEHDASRPVTLSELGAARRDTLRYFRMVLWVCGPMFAVTMFFYVVPQLEHHLILNIVWGVSALCEIVLGIFPASDKTELLHRKLATGMGLSMILMGYLFWWTLSGNVRYVELIMAIVMTILGFTSFMAVRFIINRKYLLHHELLLIFISHFSILLAALALR